MVRFLHVQLIHGHSSRQKDISVPQQEQPPRSLRTRPLMVHLLQYLNLRQDQILRQYSRIQPQDQLQVLATVDLASVPNMAGHHLMLPLRAHIN
jgi:hypothetical protein